ncbi:MAG: hypothetical protein HFJ26_04580 [Clostridia bacterium]|jgi:hypothetical protein|nr:hypothetical protein [Clostridia bacterium]
MMFKEIRKKMIYISCIISLMIMCHSVVYATAPTKNPSTSGSQNSGRTLSPSNGAYSATGSPSTGQSPYNGPYGSDIGNAPTPGATGAGPSTGILGNSSSSTDHTPDEIITEANEFVSQGTNSPMDGEKLKGASSTLYNLLLSIGIFLSVAIGVYLGVKFMLSTAEDKAKVKEALIPYIVGCVVIFSAFIIWKAIIELLGGIS